MPIGQQVSTTTTGTSTSGNTTTINSGNIIIGVNSTNNSTTNNSIIINGTLTVNGKATYTDVVTNTITNTQTVVETVVLNDSLINLAPNGLTSSVNTGLYVNINNNKNAGGTLYSGLIRQNNADNTLGSSYWYLFDSKEIDSSVNGEYCPSLTVNSSVGAILKVGSVLSTSDERLKINIKNIENALESIINLRGVKYDWKDGHGKREVGVIAQDIEKEYPELIYRDENDYLTVDYPKLSGVLIEGVKELNTKIEILSSRLEKLEEKPKRKPRIKK